MTLRDTQQFIVGGKCPTCRQSLEHPFWGFLKFGLVCGLLTFLLYQNASNFDITELRVLFWFAVVIAAMKWGLGPQVLKIVEHFVPGGVK